jgi:tetraacyldisaccharide 4'-kinase
MKWQQLWYRSNPWIWLLSPLTLLFWLLSHGRRALYTNGLLPRFRPDVPVIVVGNISVGGNGKTPVVIWLVEMLREAGYRPGVVSRGYGGKSDRYPLRVTADVAAHTCGDEPKLIFERCQCPIAVAPDRRAAVKLLLASGEVNVIICDDGLQHYALARDIELVVVDGERRYGNGRLLPMGPLREGLWRLGRVDAVICNGGLAAVGEYPMQLKPETLRPLDPSISAEPPVGEVDALAGIGYPPRFFKTLQLAGFRLNQTVEYGDHQDYSASELQRQFTERPLVMTEKDAVKCRAFTLSNWWYLPVSAELPRSFRELILNKLKDNPHGSRP